MKVHPDYTPPPRPNVSTTPVPTPVMPAGNYVQHEVVKEQTEQVLHIASPNRKIR